MKRWQQSSIGPLTSVSPSSSGDRAGTNKIQEERRSISRQGAGWAGKWRLADGPDSSSFDCKVLDISVQGVGIETSYRGRQIDLTGRKVTITAQPLAGGSVSFRLVGTIRHVSRSDPKTEFRGGSQGSLFRLGIEFVGLSKEELAMLEVVGHFLRTTLAPQ